MTTRITIDRPALRMLLDADPEFALEIKRALMAEVVSRLFERDLNRIVEGAEPELFRRAVAALQSDEIALAQVRRVLDEAVTKRDHWSGRVLPSDNVKKTVNEAAGEALARVLADATKDFDVHFSAKIDAAVKLKITDMAVNDRVDRRVARLTEEAIDRIVEERFRKRLAELSNA